MEKPRLAIIIPAWNEEATIGEVIRSVKEYGSVIVINDCSTDGTATVALDAGAVVISHETNRGYDDALNIGFEKACKLGCSFAITFDADGQHDRRLIDSFYNLLLEGNDVVLGIRPAPARLAEYVFALITKFLCGIQDPLCGMKGYDMKIYKERGFFDSCQSIGSELAIWACRHGKKFAQIQIPIHARKDTPRFGRMFKANIKIFKAIFRVITTTH